MTVEPLRGSDLYFYDLSTIGGGQPYRKGAGIEIIVLIVVNPATHDPDASLRQEVRRDTQDVVGKSTRIRLEVEHHRLARNKQVRIDRGKKTQLQGVVGAHRVAPLEPLCPEQIG